ncbi:MAG: HupE/UreJ family protein [bacterium]
MFKYSLARAHDLNSSYTSIEIQDKALKCRLIFDKTDLEKLFDLDENGDEIVTNDELLINVAECYQFFENKISIVIAGKKLFLARGDGSIVEDGQGNIFMQLDFTSELKFQPWKITLILDFLEEFGFQHKNLIKVVHHSEIQQAVLTSGYNKETFGFEGRDVRLSQQVKQFVWLGMEHIFIGYDHILFLLGLIVIGGSFKNLIKIVSSFTVAHSITLALAALQIVQIPGKVVESVIALSIVYIAAENFLIKNSDQRWLITFIFGLMHGFGFAGVLTELGLPTSGLVVSLFSFNLGVEFGQIMIVSLTFPVIVFFTRTRWQKQIVFGLSSIILIFGLIWFIERVFEFNIPLV